LPRRENPLDGLSTLRTPLGMMANGHWYAAARLEALLEEVAKDCDGAPAPDGERSRAG
jgi:hypothetical protein